MTVCGGVQYLSPVLGDGHVVVWTSDRILISIEYSMAMAAWSGMTRVGPNIFFIPLGQSATKYLYFWEVFYLSYNKNSKGKH